MHEQFTEDKIRLPSLTNSIKNNSGVARGNTFSDNRSRENFLQAYCLCFSVVLQTIFVSHSGLI